MRFHGCVPVVLAQIELYSQFSVRNGGLVEFKENFFDLKEKLATRFISQNTLLIDYNK